ncbi:MAG: hypothetical protein ACTSVD_08285 [Candidatus Thorarchaeota archaeon]
MGVNSLDWTDNEAQRLLSEATEICELLEVNPPDVVRADAAHRDGVLTTLHLRRRPGFSDDGRVLHIRRSISAEFSRGAIAEAVVLEKIRRHHDWTIRRTGIITVLVILFVIPDILCVWLLLASVPFLLGLALSIAIQVLWAGIAIVAGKAYVPRATYFGAMMVRAGAWSEGHARQYAREASMTVLNHLVPWLIVTGMAIAAMYGLV